MAVAPAGNPKRKRSGPAVESQCTQRGPTQAVTDSVPLPEEAKGLVSVLSAGPLLGEAIERIHDSRSVSSLFVD